MKTSAMRFSRGRGGCVVRSVLPGLQLLTVSRAEAASPASIHLSSLFSELAQGGREEGVFQACLFRALTFSVLG